MNIIEKKYKEEYFFSEAPCSYKKDAFLYQLRQIRVSFFLSKNNETQQ